MPFRTVSRKNLREEQTSLEEVTKPRLKRLKTDIIAITEVPNLNDIVEGLRKIPDG